MSHEMTIRQAAERARQAAIICLLLEEFPSDLNIAEVSDVATLLRRLTGNVAAWLEEESAQQESKA